MKLTIEANISEQQFMECILNQIFLGYDVMLSLSLYALAHSWHIDKLIYYKELLRSAEVSSFKNLREKRE